MTDMQLCNPAFIPRNHLVEEVIQAAMRDEIEPLEKLISVLATPYKDQPGCGHYARPPRPEEVVQATFCGT